MPTARIHRPTPTSLRRLAAALRRGELVAMPTETVYGLAAEVLPVAPDALDDAANDAPPSPTSWADASSPIASLRYLFFSKFRSASSRLSGSRLRPG